MTNIEIMDKLDILEKKCNDMQSQIEKQNKIITSSAFETYVTPAVLAKMMQCATNTVYIKIREGEIRCTRKLGNIRIPLSQFDIDIQEEINNTLNKKQTISNDTLKYEETELSGMDRIKNNVWSNKYLD